MEILIATGNAGKAREFAEMLTSDRFQFKHLKQMPGEPPQVEETGSTFRENACIKASSYARHYRMWTLADDSGLEVDALDRKPGVHSARWAEMHDAGKGDPANNELLLKQLHDIPEEKRTARFVCALALSDPDGRIILTARDAVEGTILRKPRGTNGFGYDPLFFFKEFDKTTAELDPATKHQISHRGKAIRTLKRLLNEHVAKVSEKSRSNGERL